jgi:predicted 2-oxoglutarate/Fe(II)-dependent dioxygenase YbiX
MKPQLLPITFRFVSPHLILCEHLFVADFSCSDTDESTHSFVLALNDDYEGGGTYFHDQTTTIRPEAGSVLAFRGDQMLHGGEPVTRGKRYILAAFLYQEANKSAVKNRSLISDTLRDAKKQKSDFSFDFITPSP